MNIGLWVAVGLSAVAVITDIKERRIPNSLILTGLALGVLVQLVTGGGDALWTGFLALLLAFGLLILFYLLGGLGAGDVKLLMVIGFLTNPNIVFSVFFWMAIAGGVLSLIAMGLSKKGLQSWLNLKFFFFSLFYFRTIPKFDEQASVTLPYAIPIFFGVLIVLLQGPVFN